MGRYFTRASKLTGLPRIAAERGADLPEMMRAAGLDPEALRHPEASIDYAGFCTLLKACAAAWDLPDLGLRMARQQQVDLLGPVALIIRMEPTVRAALNAVTANLVIHSNAIVAALEETADTASLIIGLRGDAPTCRENTELILAQTRIVLESAAGGPVHLVEASFRHPRGASARAVAAYFGCPIRYEAERNAVSFDSAVLDRRIERTDLAYHALIRRYLTTARAELDLDPLDAARAEVARQMELGTCSLENVAQGLRTSPRSLQRQLKAEGTTFRDLMDDWRRDRALALVTHTRLPLSQVSEALGYAEQSVFTQAFRRWYGGTPLRCRAEGAPPALLAAPQAASRA
jgi:AraC-like DNA-binding protein